MPARTASRWDGRAGTIIGAVRRNPSTVVVLAGQASEALLGAVGRSMNVVLVRPEESAEGLEAAAGALRRAAGISSPYVLVAADPLAAVAAEGRGVVPPCNHADVIAGVRERCDVVLNLSTDVRRPGGDATLARRPEIARLLAHYGFALPVAHYEIAK